MKLVYFNGRGLAETSRLLFAIAGVEYEDFRYPLKVVDMKTWKMEREEFDKDKEEGKLEMSMNKLPALHLDNGEVLCQSKTIERYLGTMFGMMGDSDFEFARIDSVCECIRDFKDAYQKVRRLEGDEREKGMEEWFSTTLAERLGALEKVLNRGSLFEDGSSPYAVGSRMSLADVVIYAFVRQFFDEKEKAFNATENCPHIRSIIEHVENNERIKEWLANRPETPF
tara:strand:+ start:3282 stop:3959 length:678 start_codon:yes stop_codon:yes gene_type:complete